MFDKHPKVNWEEWNFGDDTLHSEQSKAFLKAVQCDAAEIVINQIKDDLVSEPPAIFSFSETDNGEPYLGMFLLGDTDVLGRFKLSDVDIMTSGDDPKELDRVIDALEILIEKARSAQRGE